MKIRITSAAIILAAVLLGGYLWNAHVINSRKIPDRRIKIAASFYPLAFTAENIGQTKVSVSTITPAGIEPHEYEPTPRDAASFEKSRIILVNGLGLEPWLPNARENLKGRKSEILAVGEGLNILSDKSDPHVWLSPVLMKNIAEKTYAALVKTDPSGEEFYKKNLFSFKEKLIVLDQEYREGLKGCEKKTFITSHEAFAYLAYEYGLIEIPIAGLSPDAEPSPKKLAEISSLAKQNGIKYIFAETLADPKFSETIARETGAKTLVLNPLEGLTEKEAGAGKNYFDIMRENLANLKIALSCPQ